MQMTNEAILTQLDYTVTKSALEQLQRVIDNTHNFDQVQKHLISLHNQLKSHLSYVALSSTKDYFKIKNEAKTQDMQAEVNEMIQKWSNKYKITIQKVPQKETYYVIGFK